MEKLKYDGNQITSWDKCDWKPKEAIESSKITTLSQAMRAGAKLRPQTTGGAFADGKSCAWGAAWEGSGGKYQEGLSYSQIALELVERFKASEAYGGTFGSIACMNDSGMTREQIADKLEAQGF